jgi:hypothetical protein
LSSTEQAVSTAVFQTWMRRFEFCWENERKDLPWLEQLIKSALNFAL